ncbi:glycine C-acetyltransferase [Verrucomicrobiaceae bacterium R5-34]|uniref:2-amino-3-ketobutyrate coenzyme A ligase n=1 Tax=Oceaniferula flava TaxID=2800421 RepID=A0AAE2VCC9_9BACT|nr:glycine C-acetyltransferase [Oceaniferula flavus]MBK1830255.1 glycine C-acetyltransferase [Verrucomicrobiaceae bacterium R5-34]MBK1854846.1 glycine C-acetyltransferase [Oceaniferula flavus]MBM1136152.1 glycine C-acetyltransferase [Oceaniferula flavus]
MYSESYQQKLQGVLQEIDDAGLYKHERQLASTQNASVTLKDGRDVIIMCANNYLGLADNPEVMEAAEDAIKRWGFGMASVRFICGTQTLHRELEERIAGFLGTEDTILYTSCFDANGGLFEVLLGPDDAIISDQLNHASIIDGVRLCKARRYRYSNNDMADLEAQLKQADADGKGQKLIATDGVFSMDGVIADLKGVCDLAEKYNALVMVDDSHASGFLGKTGRGTPEYHDVMERVDIVTSTFGKALGGASGGFTSGKKEIIDLLRQRSRPYLFSNSVAPAIVAATLKVLDMLEASTELRDRLEDNTKYFRNAMAQTGFDIAGKDHPITPVMLGDAALSQQFANKLLDHGVYAVGFFFPVVPKGTARIRTQISAGHTREQLDKAIEAFVAVKGELGI